MEQLELLDFEILYKRFYKKAFYFTKSYTQDKLVAEDITSEALIKLWERVRRNEVNHPEVFLLTMLKNKALDYLKHETIKHDAFLELREIQQEELNLRISLLEACDPEEIFTSEIQQIVQDTLLEFSETSRSIFNMSRFEHLSNKKIAQTLGMSVKNVEYHLAKVLKRLRITLKDYLPIFYFFYFFK